MGWPYDQYAGTRIQIEAPEPRLALTLHELQRLVESYYELDDCHTLADVRERVALLAEQCADGGCKECAATAR